MRFGILGTGAMGGLLAGYLHENGEDVCCYDADTGIISAIHDEGLRVETLDSREMITVHPEASTDPDELGPVDVAFVLTKTMDTEQALQDADPMLTPTTHVVTIQNGLLNMETVAKHVDESLVLGGASRLGSNTVAPGHVRQLSAGTTSVGGEDYEQAQRIAATMNDAGLDTIAAADPQPHIWDKHFLNVAIKPVAALAEITNGPMIEYAETRNAMRHLIEETMEVANEIGIEILADDPVANAIDREIPPDGYHKKSSILEDVENKRPTEIESMNGAVVTLGEEYGVDTPYNRIVTQLVKGKEHAYLN